MDLERRSGSECSTASSNSVFPDERSLSVSESENKVSDITMAIAGFPK